jgi:hypothetical protein
MRQILKTAVLSGLLVTAAFAQRDWGRDRDDYRRNGNARGGYSRSIVDQVMNDLSRARSYGRVDNHERKHFDNAQRDLGRFQQKWSRGDFDRGRLDSAIENISHVAQSNQVSPRDRDILYRDLTALRDFRASGGRSAGPYGQPMNPRGGYGRNPY